MFEVQYIFFLIISVSKLGMFLQTVLTLISLQLVLNLALICYIYWNQTFPHQGMKKKSLERNRKGIFIFWLGLHLDKMICTATNSQLIGLHKGISICKYKHALVTKFSCIKVTIVPASTAYHLKNSPWMFKQIFVNSLYYTRYSLLRG